jgi:hypothetical protein
MELLTKNQVDKIIAQKGSRRHGPKIPQLLKQLGITNYKYGVSRRHYYGSQQKKLTKKLINKPETRPLQIQIPDAQDFELKGSPESIARFIKEMSRS